MEFKCLRANTNLIMLQKYKVMNKFQGHIFQCLVVLCQNANDKC